jgi:hypothetical protein
MGIPAHFSLELPRRCMKLINELLPTVETVFADGDRRELGGLTSTFLISMAGPIVVLPIERIERHLQKGREGYADDRRLNPALSRSLKNMLGGGKLQKTRFFVSGHWSFAERVADFNIADGAFQMTCLPFWPLKRRLTGQQGWKRRSGSAASGTPWPMEASST